MKKFERLPPEQRKLEIQEAALDIFCKIGFSATTMENIVAEVSLSKGGVYRLYPGTAAILSDLMLRGMHLRNDFYRERAEKLLQAGRPLTMEFLVEIIVESLLKYEKFSLLYGEFLVEKRRNPELSRLYDRIYEKSLQDTLSLIRDCGAEELLLKKPDLLKKLTHVMDSVTLSVSVLGLREELLQNPGCILSLLNELLKSNE